MMTSLKLDIKAEEIREKEFVRLWRVPVHAVGREKASVDRRGVEERRGNAEEARVSGFHHCQNERPDQRLHRVALGR